MRVAALAAASILGAGFVLGAWMFVRANVSFGPDPLLREQLDDATWRALEFLDRSDRFALPPEIEVWLARKILDYQDHPGFRADIERGWKIARTGDRRRLTALPGEERTPLTPTERARKLDVARLERLAQSRMYRELFVDPNVGDLYFERLALLLDGSTVPRIPLRWIERVLAAQNDDGGWATTTSVACELKVMAGFGCDRSASFTHPTFLATWALAQYRASAR